MLDSVEKIEFLDKGYSSDEKFLFWEDGGPRYLLRLSEIGLEERRRAQFDLLGEHHRNGVTCPRPHAFGTNVDSGRCYMVLDYIPGENAEEALPRLTEEQQYDLGLDAGKHLLRLYQMPCPDPEYDWAAHRRKKHARRVARGKELGLTFPHLDDVDRYIAANDHLLDEVPVRFQHDDYHPSNLILNGTSIAGIVDFDRCDWGDPIEDFHKVAMFTVGVSVGFARGQVQGYLQAGAPAQFWKRYNLYVAMSLISGLVWGHEDPKTRSESFRARIERMVETHDFIEGGPPSWF